MSRDYRAALAASNVPEHLHDGLLLYLEHGIAPGSFLLAVLTNDLLGAVKHGDADCQAHLADLVRFLYQHAPMGAWVTRENVDAWMDEHRARRAAAVAS